MLVREGIGLYRWEGVGTPNKPQEREGTRRSSLTKLLLPIYL